MRTTLAAVLASIIATTAHAAGDAPVRYMDLVNRSHDSVTQVEVAVAGSEDFQPESINGRLRGGGGSATIAITGMDCVVDLRFTFRDGRRLTERNVDLCRSSGLRIERLPRGDEPQASALAGTMG